MTPSADPLEAGVLLLTRNFPPLRGGMERLIHALATELARQLPLHLVGPAGCVEHAPAGTRSVHAVPIRPVWRFLIASLGAAWRSARRHRPAAILCGSGVMAPAGWLVARACRIPFVVYLHGLDIVTPHPVYRRVFLPAIRCADAVVVNSAPTAGLAVAAGIPAERITVLHPGVHIAPTPAPEARADWRRRHALRGPVLLSVGRITERKGLAAFLRDCMPALVAAEPALTLVVVGGEAAQALGRGAEAPLMPALQALAAQLGLDAHVRWLGDLPDAELTLAYGSADLLIFPVQALPGDVEGFGMVALEAAANGLPTVAYAVGGVPDAVDPQRSGTLVPAADARAFSAAVLDHLQARQGTITARSCRAFAEAFSWTSRGAALAGVVRASVVERCRKPQESGHVT